MKTLCITVASGLCLCTAQALANPAEHAERAVQAGATASGNASASAGHSLAASGQVTSAVLAVPLMATGVLATGVGSVAAQSGQGLMDAASRPIGEPLPITQENLSVMPPDMALKKPLQKPQ